MDDPHVAAIVGSLREESNTAFALQHALDAADEAGATTDLIDLRPLDLPIFDADHRDVGDAPDVKRRVRDADGLILGTPVYHHSYSSVLKNALDYCGFDEFEDTVVGLLCVSGGGLPGPTFEHLTAVCHGMNAWVVPRTAAIPKAYDRIDDDGRIADPAYADRVEALGRNVARYAGIETPDR